MKMFLTISQYTVVLVTDLSVFYWSVFSPWINGPLALISTPIYVGCDVSFSVIGFYSTLSTFTLVCIWWAQLMWGESGVLVWIGIQNLQSAKWTLQMISTQSCRAQLTKARSCSKTNQCIDLSLIVRFTLLTSRSMVLTSANVMLKWLLDLRQFLFASKVKQILQC